MRDAAADVINQTAAPFQNLTNPNVGVFEKAQGVVGSAMSLASAPTAALDNAFARGTNFISKVLPCFPAATVGSLVVGMPHTHTHPPSLIPPAPPIPLPAIGAVVTCCPTVFIGGMPAARAGDYGVAPTCGGFAPIFEIFTGSSKVFIGGSRAARVLDLTRQCAPGKPPPTKSANAIFKLGKAARAASKVMGGLGKVSMALGVVGAAKRVVSAEMAQDSADDAAEAAQAEGGAAAAEAEGDAKAAAGEAAAAALAAAMMAADMAAGVAQQAMGALMGKDPGLPPCIGAITTGVPTVQIGGFPMPSWSDIAKGLKKLGKKLGLGKRGGGKRGKLFCFECS